jgi:electron transport complex protein RnfB
MLTGTVILTALTVTLAVALVLASRYLPPAADPMANHLEQLLPRIQCAQCGYPGCRAYAVAIAAGGASINRCPPGGDETIRELAHALGREPEPLLASLGNASLDKVARIDESLCIGCNLCARVCPVDAIVGISQMMHTVITTHCTGCELCLPPCPVDCIVLEPRDD